MWVSVKSSPQFFPFCCFQGRPLSVQQQMMQQSRQLDPNLLVKQQTPPSQQQSIHQPAMKSFLENVMPHTTPELQKGPSPINAFSNFPIGGFPCGQSIQQMHRDRRLTGFSYLLVQIPCGSHTFLNCSLSESCHTSSRVSLSSCRGRLSPFKKMTIFEKFHTYFQWVRIKRILLLNTLVSGKMCRGGEDWNYC